MRSFVATARIIAVLTITAIIAACSQSSSAPVKPDEQDRYAERQHAIDYVLGLGSIYKNVKCHDTETKHFCSVNTGVYGRNYPYNPWVSVDKNKVYATSLSFSSASSAFLAELGPNQVIVDIAKGAHIISDDEVTAEELTEAATKFLGDSTLPKHRVYIGSGAGNGVSKTFIFSSKKVIGLRVEVVFECVSDVTANMFEDNCDVIVGKRD